MRTEGWERWAPLSGIIFVGLTLPTLFLPPTPPPSADAPAADWGSFVHDHRSALLASVCLSGLAVIAFMVFLGTLVTRLRAAGQELLAVIAFGAGFVTASIWYVWLSFEGVMAWSSPSGLDPTVVKTLLAAADFAFPFPVALLVVASSLAAWRSRALPKWLARVGVVGGLWVIVGAVSMARAGFFAPTSGARLTGWGFFFLWALVVSIVLLRKPQQERPASA